MKNFLNLIVLLIFAFNANAARITDNNLKLGNSTTTGNKKIEFDTGAGTANKKLEIDASTGDATLNSNNLTLGDGASGDKKIIFNRGGSNATLKWNEVSSKLQFAKDGATFKDFGSGTGSGGDGGVNLLSNATFEDAIGGVLTDWSNTGGTLTQQPYTNVAEGENYYARFVATSSGQYFESLAKAVPDFGVGACDAKINYKTTDAANWKIQVYDGSSNLLKEELIYTKTWGDGFAAFPCPTAGTTVKIRVISLGAGTIEADKAYLGKENRTFKIKSDISGWKDGGVVVIGGSTTAPVKGSPVVYDKMFYRVVGDSLEVKMNYRHTALGSATNGSGTYLFSLPAGYTINLSKVGALNSIETSLGFFNGKLSNGTFIHQYVGGVYPYSATQVFAAFQYASETDASSGAGVIGSGLGSMGYAQVNYSLTFTVPVNEAKSITEDVVVAEAQDWFIDANIGGATPSLGTAAVSSYSEITDASLDMVLNSGSAIAKIPCSGTNSSSGVTCSSGSEGVGLVFTPPQPGRYEVCAEFVHGITNTANGLGETVFQFVETTPGTQTIIQEGNSRVESRNGATTSSSTTLGFPHKVCGFFNFTSVSERTIRLMYEQNIGGAGLTSSIVWADRNGLTGQRDVHIYARPLLSAYNRPYSMTLTQAQQDIISNFNNSVYNSKKIRSEICRIDISGTAIIGDTTMCNWVSSATRSALGTLVVNFQSGYFASGVAPVCVSAATVGGVFVNVSPSTTDLQTTLTMFNHTGAASDTAVLLYCAGRR